MKHAGEAVVRRAALGALIVMMFPAAAHAQMGKHIAIGASVGSHDYASDRLRQGVGIMLLYRVAPNGNEENGLSWGPSATIGFSRADVSSDVAGGDVTVGKLQSIPALVGFGPHYRFGRWWAGLSVTAGASFNSFRSALCSDSSKPPELLLQRSLDLREMVPAVPERVIFDEELRRERRTAVEGDRVRAIELFVGELADGVRGGPASRSKELDRFGLRDRGLLLAVLGVDIRNHRPRHALDGLAGREGLSQLHLDRIHVADVVHDDTDGPAVAGTAGGAPLRVGQTLRERGQRGRSLLDPIR